MSKYQEALDKLYRIIDSEVGSYYYDVEFPKIIRTLQELVNKETPMKPIRKGKLNWVHCPCDELSRLAKEKLENYRNTYDKFDGIESNEFEKICDELIEYKSLEEELGIDLITLFKALKDGIWYKCINGNLYRIPYSCLNLSYSDTYGLWVEYHKQLDGLRVHLKDYGKTWALSRNELEEKDDE